MGQFIPMVKTTTIEERIEPMLSTILLYFALVFAFLAAFNVPSPGPFPIAWGWLAIAFWILSIILGGHHI